MRKILGLISSAGLAIAVALFVGCGSGGGGSFPPDGVVAKGPVAGATVTYVGGGSVVTNSSGRYRCNYNYEVRTAGGVFVDVNGKVRQAPDMASPKGICNVTPLTTLYYYADPSTRNNLVSLFGSLDELSVVVEGTVASEDAAIAKLNESIGEVLTQIKEGNAISYPAYADYIGSLAHQVALIDLNAVSTNAIINAIEDAGEAPVEIDMDAVAQIADTAIVGAVFSSVPPVNKPVSVDVDGQNATPYNAGDKAVVFTVHPTATYTYYIDEFTANDKLVFDEGTAIDVTNADETDGSVDVFASLNGYAVTIHITGIAQGSDHLITGVNGFKNVFGQKSLTISTDSTGVGVDVDSANSKPYNAAKANLNFEIHPTSTYTFGISGFGSGDKLIFDNGTAVSLNNISGADGIIDVFGVLNGQEVTVHLTGIATGSDAAIYGVLSFIEEFGEGSLQP